MKTFLTLLQREWMQYQRGWMIALGVPFVLFVLAITFGQIQLSGDAQEMHGPPLALAVAGGLIMVTLVLAVLSVVLQTPGLARRDQQDRSIEFWLSLPTRPSQSIAATVLMHWLAFPVAAVFVGMLGGLALSPVVVLRESGPSGLAEVPWIALTLTSFGLSLRLALGLVMALLWLSPLVLGLMAASAWFKRWGAPVLVGGLVGGHLLIQRLFGSLVVRDTVAAWFLGARRALVGADDGVSLQNLRIEHPNDLLGALPDLAIWLISDAGRALAALASPQLLAGLVLASAAFAALVLRRSRGA